MHLINELTSYNKFEKENRVLNLYLEECFGLIIRTARTTPGGDIR